MFTYSKIYIFRNNSGITWDNWCCSCFTCCYRCGLGNHHSLWALASFILSLNCWSFCWFWLKSQIHRRIYRILWVERVLWWILLWNKSSTWTSVWGLQSPHCNQWCFWTILGQELPTRDWATPHQVQGRTLTQSELLLLDTNLQMTVTFYHNNDFFINFLHANTKIKKCYASLTIHMCFQHQWPYDITASSTFCLSPTSILEENWLNSAKSSHMRKKIKAWWQ